MLLCLSDGCCVVVVGIRNLILEQGVVTGCVSLAKEGSVSTTSDYASQPQIRLTRLSIEAYREEGGTFGEEVHGMSDISHVCLFELFVECRNSRMTMGALEDVFGLVVNYSTPDGIGGASRGDGRHVAGVDRLRL